MDIKTLEDFIALAETGSFSKAATIRHVTQPAFSRRIKALENWFGVTLIDRSHYPTKLTTEGEELYQTARQVIVELYQCREEIKAGDKEESTVLKFAMPHTLSMTFFPLWRTALEEDIGRACIKMTTGNIHDTAQLLDSGNCDFVLYFNYEAMPTSCFHRNDFEKLKVGVETLLPISVTDAEGLPRYNLDAETEQPLPYLAWGQPTLAHHVVTGLINQNNLGAKLHLRYQNQLAAALRAEALLGNGIAWLTEGIVKQDLATGNLVRASSAYDIPIDIYMVRKAGSTSALAQSWWHAIEDRYQL